MTGEFEAVLAVDKFLTCKYTVEDDYRLISQVKIWSILSNVFQTFGTNIRQPVSDSLITEIQKFRLEIDAQRLEWSTRFKHHRHIGNYPRKGVGLHHHFAKLFLCSHAFRGASTPNMPVPEMSLEMREIADTAVLSAISILRSINTDKEFQSFLSELPLYFDTMIAFASVFLFRITTSYTQVMQVDVPTILSLISKSVTVLEEITSKIRPAHLLSRIPEGLKQLLGQVEEAKQRETQNAMISQQATIDVDMGLHNVDNISQDQFDWSLGEPVDGFSLGDYDFLSDHQLSSHLELWPIDHIQQQTSQIF